MLNKPSLPEIELTLRDFNVARRGTEFNRLNKDQQQLLLDPLAKFLKNYQVVGDTSSSETVVRKMNILARPATKKLLKDDLALLYLSLRDDYRNFYEIAAKDEKVMRMWKLLITSHVVTAQEVREVLGRPLVVSGYGYWSLYTFAEAMFAPLNVRIFDRYAFHYSNYEASDFSVSLPLGARYALAKLFFGEKALEPKLRETLPEHENLVVENFEDSIPADMIYLSGLTMTKTDRTYSPVTAGGLNSLKKSFSTRNFVPDGQKFPVDRIEMLSNAYGLFDYATDRKKREMDSRSPAAFAKFVVEKLPLYIHTKTFGMLLPGFKSFTSSWSVQTNIVEVSNIVKDLLTPAAYEWMALDNLSLRYLCAENGKRYSKDFVPLFTGENRRRNTLKRKNGSQLVDPNNSGGFDWYNEIDFPFILHWIKLLCALGLLEIALNKEEPDDMDQLEGMRYVRLTALGRYAFGIDKEYTRSAEEDSIFKLDVDDRQKIITVISENCPFLPFLSQVSDKISSRRFHLTPESLMKGCMSSTVLKERVDNLKKLLNLNDYPGLTAVVEEALKRAECACSVTSSFSVLKLSPGLDGLIKLISQNSHFSGNVFFAEGGYLLVMRHFLPELKKECLKKGYIIE